MDRDVKRGRAGSGDDIDPDAPPSAEEVAAAEALRLALSEPHRKSPAADFARALSLAHEPRPMSPDENRALVAQAIERARGRDVGAPKPRTRRGVAALAWGGGLAMAAALALVIGATRSSDRASQPASAVAAAVPVIEPLVPVRSTQSLFREPFARAGGESARIDRIASARAGDLRDNRFAAWGVR